jgi:hypothetical protein
VLIVAVEVTVSLIGEIEISPRLTGDHDRHTEKARHRRMPGREPIGLWGSTQIRDPQRPRLGNQQPQDTTTPWAGSDRLLRLVR